ncbi:RmlC-like cupins superfamily protein [Abeliophyllum distichum]|uniref:RmlC-like cupins superfamily protein n=1 Tax=Abeliophyllum distichum TaxID=126358 RepID=A0ABD1TL47_9LAMI
MIACVSGNASVLTAGVPSVPPRVDTSYKHLVVCAIPKSPAKNISIRRGLGVKIRAASAAESESIIMEKSGIKVVNNPPESKLSELGVRSWPKWGCPPSKFPWTYSSKETCYLLKGKVKVYPEGSDEAVEFGAGDLVEFPKGMSCTWDVSEAVDKHYNFE